MVIEPSFGGAAEDWEKIARTLAEETTVITYDRAPYGASSPARDARTPRDIAADLDGLLRALGRDRAARARRALRGRNLRPRLRRRAPGPGGRHGPRGVKPRGPAAGARPAAVRQRPGWTAPSRSRRSSASRASRAAAVTGARSSASGGRSAGSPTRRPALPPRRPRRPAAGRADLRAGRSQRSPTGVYQAWHDLHRTWPGCPPTAGTSCRTAPTTT